MHAGSRLVHLSMPALEPRCFRKSSSFLAEDRDRDFGFVPSRFRFALRRTFHATSPTAWGGLAARCTSSCDDLTSLASLLPMLVASRCSHLAMSSPRCGTSSREVIWRCALPFGPSSPRNEISFWKTSPAMHVILVGNEVRLATLPIHRELIFRSELTSPCSHLGMSSRRDQLTLR